MLLAAIGVIVSAMSYFIAFPNGGGRERILFALLVVCHLAMAVVYHLYSGWDLGVDAVRYFVDPYEVAGRTPPFPGTPLIYNLVYFLRETFGSSLLQLTLFFQFFGMLGLAMVARIYVELGNHFGRAPPLWLYATLFLPGLHFWTVPIGKDGLAFAGIAVLLWAMLQPKGRWLWFFVALVLIAAPRPHIAAVCILALLAQWSIGRKGRRLPLLFLLAAVALGLVILVVQAISGAYIPLTDFETTLSFVLLKFERAAAQTSEANLTGLIFPFRLLSILFRPLYFDTAGVFGLVVSTENIILIGLSFHVVSRWKTISQASSSEPQVRLALILGFALLIVITAITFNQGTGVRQKIMVMPIFLTLLARVALDDSAKPMRRIRGKSPLPQPKKESGRPFS